jgi:beta-glucanase (GH16 family)
MLISARRRPVRWIAAIALMASAAVVPVATASTAGAAFTSDACGTMLAKSTGGTWTCSFVDNFDGTKLDTNKWTAMDTSVIGWYKGDTCFLKDQGYRVRAGKLELVASKRAPFTCTTPTGGFTTQHVGGAIASAGKFSQTYGRFEARMKFPNFKGAGLHGGFWMNPQKPVYGVWPASGEIDVAEWFSVWADRMYPSLHYSGRTNADTAWDCSSGTLGQFHQYAVEWKPTVMNFFYDGKLCFSRSWDPVGLTAPQPFDQPFYNVLTWGAGTSFDAPDANTVFPSTLTVDYVKTWY